MADFDAAIAVVLQHEDPGLTGAVTVDDGGMTRWGISKRAYPSLDIARLSLRDAEAIYRRDYWTPLNCDAINDQNVATKVLDMGVNMGIAVAARLLQRAVNSCWASPIPPLPLAVDGAVGPLTLKAVNETAPADVIAQLRSLSADHYRAIVALDPMKYGRYWKGWLARAQA